MRQTKKLVDTVFLLYFARDPSPRLQSAHKGEAYSTVFHQGPSIHSINGRGRGPLLARTSAGTWLVGNVPTWPLRLRLGELLLGRSLHHTTTCDGGDG